MSKEAIKPYHRRDSETAPAWAAFVVYLNLGIDRTVSKTARALSKTTSTVSVWSRKYNWKKRALAYDRENDAAKRKAELAAIEEMRKRHIDGALMLQDISKIELAKIKKHATENEESLALEPREIREFYKEGTSQERLNRGEPSEIVHKIDEAAPDLAGIDIQELRVLKSVYARYKKKGDSEKELPENDDIDGDNETDIIDI